jgi:hypothetical protein
MNRPDHFVSGRSDMTRALKQAREPFRSDGPDRLLALHHEPSEVTDRTRRIYDAMLNRSAHIREGNFTGLGTVDLRLLFELYDAEFFGGLLDEMRRKEPAVLNFGVSSRMTRASGTTTRRLLRTESPNGPRLVVSYEIAISTVLLFGSFREGSRTVTVGGLECKDRLEALQRIFEHELLHLAEYLAWGASSCAGGLFQELSRRIFGHEGVTHDLVTPRETAAVAHGIKVGDRVTFSHQGANHNGMVNRITKRATILVEDPNGEPFSDGRRYATFYVPVAMLRKEASPR